MSTRRLQRLHRRDLVAADVEHEARGAATKGDRRCEPPTSPRRPRGAAGSRCRARSWRLRDRGRRSAPRCLSPRGGSPRARAPERPTPHLDPHVGRRHRRARHDVPGVPAPPEQPSGRAEQSPGLGDREDHEPIGCQVHFAFELGDGRGRGSRCSPRTCIALRSPSLVRSKLDRPTWPNQVGLRIPRSTTGRAAASSHSMAST